MPIYVYLPMYVCIYVCHSKELSSLGSRSRRMKKIVNKGCCCCLLNIKYQKKKSLSQRSLLVAVWSEALVYRKVGRVPASSVLRV